MDMKQILIFIQLDTDMLDDIERMKKPLEVTRAKIIGSTAVRLEGDPIQCRLRECNSGKILCLFTAEFNPFALRKAKMVCNFGLSDTILAFLSALCLRKRKQY